MIDPEDFSEHAYTDLTHLIDNMPVDFRNGEYTGYTAKQLHDYTQIRRDEELQLLFILDVVLAGLTLFFFWGAWL